MPKKTKAGLKRRPARQPQKTEIVFFRVTPKTRKEYSRRSKRCGYTHLSDWIRDVLNDELAAK